MITHGQTGPSQYSVYQRRAGGERRGISNDDWRAVHTTPLDGLVARVNHGDHDQHLAWVLRDIEELRNRPDERRPETLTSIDAALQAIRTRMRAVEPRR